MYNKKQFNKYNNKKILHKVKKQWVTISLALFMLIGGGALATHVNASANAQSHQPVINVRSQSNSAQTPTISQRAKQLHTSLVRNAGQQSMRLGSRRGRLQTVVKGRYTQTNSYRRLNQSGFRVMRFKRPKKGIPRYAIYDRYAPNSRLATVPRGIDPMNNLLWFASGSKYFTKDIRSMTIYSYNRAKRLWILEYRGRKGSRNRRRVIYHRRARRTYRRRPAKRYRRVRKSRRLRMSRSWSGAHPRQVRRYRRQPARARRYRRRVVRRPARRVRRVYRRQIVRKPRNTYKGLYMNTNGDSDVFLSNADLSDMSNIHHDSYSDFSDDYVHNNKNSNSFRTSVVGTTNFDGYQLDQINHQIPGTDGNVWVFPSELSHNKNRILSSDIWNDFDNLTQAAIKHNKRAMKQISDEIFERTFTPEERQRISNIRQQYNYLEKNEDQTSDNDLADLRQHVIDWINFYRTDLYNLQPVSENSSYDAHAQQGAEDGQDPEDMTPASTNGEPLAPNEDYVNGYFTDNGNLDNNGETGHRDSVLNPQASQVGVGQDGSQNALFFRWGLDSGVGNGQTNPSDVVAYPNQGIFPLSDAQRGEYWSYQFASHPYEMGLGNYSPNISVYDDTANTEVSVGNITTASDEVYYSVDQNALKANHEYTITIQGLPTGDVQYTTKLFKLNPND